MPIKSISIKNILVFNHQRVQDENKQTLEIINDSYKTSGFHLSFCDGINVLIGANGVGKTPVLKMLYACKRFPGSQSA